MLTKSKSKPILKARALKPGAKVALVCPASRPQTPAIVARCQRLVSELGMEPVLGAHVLGVDGFMAGSDSDRLADLNGFLADDSIAAIFCVTGGYGSLHLLNGLNYQALLDKPKLIVGSDDNCCLLNAIQARTGLVTLHGPNLEQIKTRHTFELFKTAVTSKAPLAALSALEPDSDVVAGGSEFYCCVEGVAEGRLVGGNLTAFASLLGTDFDPGVLGGILFLEDVNEKNGTLDRWFTSLYLAGHLQYASGVVMGSFENCSGRDAVNVLSVMDLFGDRLQYLRKTSCFGLPFGQRANTAVVPLGVNGQLDSAAGELRFLEAALT